MLTPFIPLHSPPRGPNSAMSNEQLEGLGTQAMATANITPLPPATWDMVRWENAEEVLTEKIAAGKADSHSIDNDLQSFVLKVDGTAREFRCMVPMYDPQGLLVHCGHQVQRRDRILRHVKDVHLHYRPYGCGGKCGIRDWYRVSLRLLVLRLTDAPFSVYAAADQRYLMLHIHPDMVQCGIGSWYVTSETSMGSY